MLAVKIQRTAGGNRVSLDSHDVQVQHQPAGLHFNNMISLHSNKEYIFTDVETGET